MKTQHYYHAARQSGKLPKWLGVTLGGIFATIAISSGLLIVRLTRSPNSAPMASLATGPLPAIAPVAAPVPSVAATDTTGQRTPPAAVSPPPIADGKHRARRGDHGKRIAVEPATSTDGATTPAASRVERGTTAADHDRAEKPREKDELDKLLGL